MANQVPPLDTSAATLTTFLGTATPLRSGSPRIDESTIAPASDSSLLAPLPPADPNFSPILPRRGDRSDDVNPGPRLEHDSEPPPTVQSTTSSLDGQAQLGWTRSLLDKTSRAIWWTSSLPGRAVSAVVNKGANIATTMIIKKAAQKGVKIAGSPALETPLKTLRDCLFEMRQKITERIPLDDPLKQRTIAALTTFLNDHKKHLSDCYSPTAWYFPEGLNREQHAKFSALLKGLQKNLSMASEGPFLQPLCEFLDQCCQYQHETHQKKLADQLVRRVTSPTSSTVSAAGDAPVTPAAQKSRIRIPRKIEKTDHPNQVPSILKEFDELKSLGFRIALALLFLPEDAIHKRVEEIGTIAALIKKSNSTLDPHKSPNELFQDLIYTEIDNSNLNYFQKKWRKLTCWLLAPSVLFMAEHVLDQGQDVILYLIGLSPEQRLEMVVKMCIEPSRGFIGWLQSEYKTIAGTENLGATVGEAIGSAIDQIKIKDRHGKELTSKELINRLISSLFDRYTPSLNWSKTATAHFEHRAQESKSPFFSLWFISWSYVSWTINILSAPWRWCLNRITRKVLKAVAVSQIHAKLSDKDGASLDFGKLALNSIYKTMLEKLRTINRSQKGSETDSSRRAFALHQRGFVEKSVQDSINKLVSDFLELLYIQGSNVNKLHAQLSPANFFEQGKKGVMEAAFAPGIQKATEEIIHGLQIFLEDHTFSAALLEVMQDIHSQCLRFKTGDTETSLARLENEFYVELKDTVKNGIQTVIVNKLDPSKHIQEEADLFVDGLADDANAFYSYFIDLANLTPTSLRALAQTRDSYLADSSRRRREKALKETNPTIQLQITATSDQFYELSRPIFTKIDELVRLAHTKKQIEDLNEDLRQLIAPLEAATSSQPLQSATAFYSPLQLTLQRVITKNYPESVQSLISKLQGNFEAWRTEALKRDNQALINASISALKKAIDKAIDENTRKTDELSGTIDEGAKAAVHLTQNLTEWTNQLTYFECVPDKVEIDAFRHILTYFGNETLPPLIISKIDDFVIFLRKNHHIKGILSFVIKAYLELPRKSPKEFKKIIDIVKQRPTTPSVPPSPLRGE